MTDADYWRRLARAWTHAEHPGEGGPWRELFSSTRPGREHMMAEDVRELVDRFPERLRIWRGAVRGVNEAGLAWTLSREDAVAWAHRNVGLHNGGAPVVLRGSVARGDVIALFVERLEMEVVALPENVTVEAIEDVAGERAPSRRGTSHAEIEPA